MDKVYLGKLLCKAERNRKLLGILKIPIYGSVLIWIVFVFGISFLRPEFMQQAGNSLLNWFLPAAVVLVVCQFVFTRLYASFTTTENQVVKQIVAELFPEGRVHAVPPQVTMPELRGSKFFGRLDAMAVPACVFSSIELPVNGSRLALMDLGVVDSRRSGAMPGVGMLSGIKMLFRAMLGRRLENAQFGFRGLFARVELKPEVPGCVVVLPDGLEASAGYMARSVQSLTSFDGNRLVQLEDPEFEHNFAVYATDEVVARRVLTPAVMRAMTLLRNEFGRDIYFTYNAQNFYFAVSMPDGLLTVKGSQPEAVVSAIESKLRTAGSVLRVLKIGQN